MKKQYSESMYLLGFFARLFFGLAFRLEDAIVRRQHTRLKWRQRRRKCLELMSMQMQSRRTK